MKRKQPYWIRRTHLLRRDEYICSECRAVSQKPYAHCPRCGTKLSREKSDLHWIAEAELMDFVLDDEEDL